jgi:hypothetical protein
MDYIQTIKSKKHTVLAYIVKGNYSVDKTTFLTPDSSNLQVGFVTYPGNSKIKRHIHKTIHRKLDRTEEVLIVRKGRCKIELYDEQKEFVTREELSKGDFVILVAGGHGFEIIKDTVLLEIKQGPYTGLVEKERF